MNISSILITILGIIIILALYVMSRMGQRDFPKNESIKIPEIKDADGKTFTSVLDDIPASDDLSAITPPNKEATSSQQFTEAEASPNPKKQLVLFIAAKDDIGLDGLLVKQTLINNGLKLGDKDIYHYYHEKNNSVNSLFRIANGIEPWTLKDDDLINKKIVGISIVMLLPTTINSEEATTLFMNKADTITGQVNGVLKNQQQELLSTQDRNNILSS